MFEYRISSDYHIPPFDKEFARLVRKRGLELGEGGKGGGLVGMGRGSRDKGEYGNLGIAQVCRLALCV